MLVSAPYDLPDLGLLAQEPDGSFAAYIGVTYDQANAETWRAP